MKKKTGTQFVKPKPRKKYFFKTKEEMEKKFPIDDIEKWEDAGRPELWVFVEKLNDYSVFVDHGHGRLMLKYKNREIAREHDHITRIKNHPNIVVLDKEYYDVKKYIWT